MLRNAPASQVYSQTVLHEVAGRASTQLLQVAACARLLHDDLMALNLAQVPLYQRRVGGPYARPLYCVVQ